MGPTEYYGTGGNCLIIDDPYADATFTPTTNEPDPYKEDMPELDEDLLFEKAEHSERQRHFQSRARGQALRAQTKHKRPHLNRKVIR